jgi:pyruvate decarboxylase
MSEIKIGVYLFERLKELGVRTIWGVPGDYELAILDLPPEAGLQFSGNPNELVASYATDGYARVNGVGAWIDTFGPGELSSYCGHAGAYTEFVPVAHIVGYPGRDAMNMHAIMHHTLGTGQFDMFHEMVKHISAGTTILLDPKTAPQEIDKVLQIMLDESRPVYIGVPVDMSHLMTSSEGLKTPLRRALPPNDEAVEQRLVAELRALLEEKEKPIFIVDGNAVRNEVVGEARKLSEITGLPTFTTCMGKGSVNEELPTFGGVYQGAGSFEGVRKAVETSDAVFWIGNFPVWPTLLSTVDKSANNKSLERLQYRRVHGRCGRGHHCGLPALLHQGTIPRSLYP